MDENIMESEQESQIQGKRPLFRKTGKQLRKGVDLVDIAPIQPDEPIIHGFLRRAAHRWEQWQGTKKTGAVILLGVVLYALYYYFTILVPVFVSIFLLLVLPYEYAEEDQAQKKDIVKVRVYRPDGRYVPVNVSLNEKKVLTMQVYKPTEEQDGKLKRKKYEEYYFAKRLKDPAHPKAINLFRCRIIDTGYSEYVFAVDVNVRARTVIGEEEMYPAGAMIPLIEESVHYINEGLKNIKEGLKKATITPEDGAKMIELAEIAKAAFYEFIHYARKKGVEFVRLKDLNKEEQTLVFFMNRLTSEFFTQFRDWKSWKDIPVSMREARVNSIENMRSELFHIFRFYQMHEPDIRQEEWAEAFQYYYETSGMSPAAAKADQEELVRQIREIRTKAEANVTKDEVTSVER